MVTGPGKSPVTPVTFSSSVALGKLYFIDFQLIKIYKPFNLTPKVGVASRAAKLSGTWNLVPQMQFLSSKNLKCNFWRQEIFLLGHLK